MEENIKEQTAFGMSYQEFYELYDECGGFDSEFYKNHPILTGEESFIDFLGCASNAMKDDSNIRKKLG